MYKIYREDKASVPMYYRQRGNMLRTLYAVRGVQGSNGNLSNEDLIKLVDTAGRASFEKPSLVGPPYVYMVERLEFEDELDGELA